MNVCCSRASHKLTHKTFLMSFWKLQRNTHAHFNILRIYWVSQGYRGRDRDIKKKLKNKLIHGEKRGNTGIINERIFSAFVY